jgi:hypothetical protein
MVSGTADPHRTIFLGDVRDDNDLRVAGHAPAFTEYIEFDLAKAAGERNLLRRSETLIAKEDNAVSVVGVLNCGKGGVVEVLGRLTPRISAPMAAPVGNTSMNMYHPPQLCAAKYYVWQRQSTLARLGQYPKREGRRADWMIRSQAQSVYLRWWCSTSYTEGSVYLGEHQGVVSRDPWSAAYTILMENPRTRANRNRAQSAALLRGSIFGTRPFRSNPRKPAYCETGRPYLRQTSGLV